MEKRPNNRKCVTGKVVSDKMMKTRVVEVETMVRHPKYGKLMKRASRCKAHDEQNASHIGDLVELMSVRPMSKEKNWAIVRIVSQNKDKEVVAA